MLHPRRLLFVVLIAAITTETGAGITLFLLSRVRASRFSVPREHFLDRVADIDEQRLRQRSEEDTYDAVLGWRNAPGSARVLVNSAGHEWTIHYDLDGARHDPVSAPDALIATFGASFTQCDEVDDDETWQHYLTPLATTHVANFGVGAYGPDQSVLLLERKLEAGLATPIIVLTLHEENINLIVNRYRPYYQPHDPMTLGFKPRFILREGELELLANPLILDRRANKPIADHLAEAAQDDYWFEYNAQRPRVSFPFTYQLSKLILDVAIEKRMITANPLASLPRNLWAEPSAVRLMTALVRRFVETSRRHRATPVLFLLPEIGDAGRWRSDRARYRAWLDEIRTDLEGEGLRVVDMAESIVDPEHFRVGVDQGHASPEANRSIARALLPTLRPLVDRVREHGNRPEARARD